MSDQAENKLSIAKFNGIDYAVWKFQMLSFFEAKDLDEVLTGVKTELNKTTFDVKEKKAKSYLLSTLDNKHVKLILSCKTVREMWSRLSDIHEQRSASNKIMLQTQFFDAKMNPDEKVSDFISRVEFLASQLNDLGEKVSESTLVNKIVSGLTELYSNFMTSWLNMKSDELTLSNLIPRLLAEESIKHKFDQVGGSALTARSQSNKKGKPNSKSGKQKKKIDIEELKKRTTCRKCGKKGHWKKECPEAKKTEKDDGSKDKPDTVSETMVAEVNFTDSAGGWIVDSGATEHMTYDKSGYVNYKPLDTPKLIRYGNEGYSYGIGVGDILVESILDGGKRKQLTFTNVLHVPDLRRKLFSVSAVTNHGLTGQFKKDQVVIIGSNGETKLIAKRDGNLYRANVKEVPSESNAATADSSIKLLHERFAHVNTKVIQSMVKDKLAEGLPDKLERVKKPGERKSINCISCSIGKQHHRSYRLSTRRRAEAVGERLHVDLCGPVGVETYGGNKYFVLFKDEYSNYRHVFFVKTKDQVFESVQTCVADIEADTNHKVKRLVSDCGSELISKRTQDFLLSRGISHEKSAPFTPQQNGFIERENRTVMEAARSMMFHRKVEEKLWGEAVRTAVYLLNRVPNKNTGAATPFQRYFERKPRVQHIRVFGSLAIAKNQAKKRSGYQKKLDPRGTRTILVGYDRDFTYRAFDPVTKKVIITRDIDVDETLSYNDESPGVNYEHLSSFINQLPEDSTMPEDLVEMPMDSDSDETIDDDQDEHDGDGNQGEEFDIEAICNRPYRSVSPVVVSPRSDPAAGTSGQEVAIWETPQAAMHTPWHQHQASPPVPRHRHEVSVPVVRHHFDDRPLPQTPVGASSRTRANPVLRRKRPARRSPLNLIYNLRSKRKHDSANLAESDYAEALISYGDEPTSFTEAIESPEADFWMQAMDDEIRSLMKNETWRLVALPQGRQPISCKWVYKRKHRTDGTIERYKARLVARGFTQRPGLDYTETFSPVVRLDSIRIILALAAAEDLEIVHFDVRTAFLHGALEEDIFMSQPTGYEVEGDLVCKLEKSLYGLKQASRAWNTCFVQFLRKFDLFPLEKDSCILVRKAKSDNVKLIIAIYVDDGLACSNSADMLNSVIEHLKKRFEITVMSPTCFVGLQITRDRKKRTLAINQEYYINRIVERFNMSNAKPASTPADVNLKLTKLGGPDGEESEDANVPYREAVGSLLYAVLGTRPDIGFIVNYLARFSERPKTIHWNAIKRVFRYLLSTKGHGIVYGAEEGCNLNCYVDADFAGDLESRKSTTGYLLMINGSAVVWKSTKQSIVATSTTEAEFVAASMACREVLWARQLLFELGYKLDSPTMMNIDNQGAIKLIQNQQIHAKTKHIDVTYMFVRDVYNKREIDVAYIPSNDQIADIMTKPLPKSNYNRLCSLAGMSM